MVPLASPVSYSTGTLRTGAQSFCYRPQPGPPRLAAFVGGSTLTAMAQDQPISPTNPPHPEINGHALVARAAERLFAADNAPQEMGIRPVSVSPGRARRTMRVTETMLNGHGICHGGYIFGLADSAFVFASNTYGHVAEAAGAQIAFIGPARAGDILEALSVEPFPKGRSGLYDVTVVRLPVNEVIAEFRGRSRTVPTPLEGPPPAEVQESSNA